MRRTMGRGMALFAMLAGMWLWPQAAAAQDPRGWYLNAGLGLNQLDLVGNEDLGANLGFRAVVGGGFRFHRHWALELDTGFIRNTVPRPTGPDGSMSQLPLVGTLVFHLANATKFEPFVGAGVGGTTFFTDGKTGTDVTLGFKGGIRRQVRERVAIGIDYTYFMWGGISLILGEPAGDDTVNLTVQWRP